VQNYYVPKMAVKWVRCWLHSCIKCEYVGILAKLPRGRGCTHFAHELLTYLSSINFRFRCCGHTSCI